MDAARLMDSDCETELLARIARQDPDALAAFYDRTSAVLFHVAHSIMRDRTAAEDILQEVYIRIWDKAEVFDPALGKPISWAIALTRNKALDMLRSTRRRASTLQTLEEGAVELPASKSTADDVELRESAAQVRQALGGLSPKQREALELSFLKGLPHAEIAEVLGEPLGTIKAWIRRGIIEIRKQMQNDR